MREREREREEEEEEEEEEGRNREKVWMREGTKGGVIEGGKGDE